MDKQKIAKELVKLARELVAASENILDKKYPQYGALIDALRSEERDEIDKVLLSVGVDRQDAAQIAARVLTKRMTIRRAIETSSSFEYSGEKIIESLKRVKVAKDLMSVDVKQVSGRKRDISNFIDENKEDFDFDVYAIAKIKIMGPVSDTKWMDMSIKDLEAIVKVLK